ncbi:MAG: HDIG domain-containing metalloprotein [Minisyncoccia bacterium]
MTREEALKILLEKIKTPNLIKHSLAVEAGMRELALYFKEDEKKWGIAGLLHDIDYEETKDDPLKHSLVGAEYLKSLGFDDDIVEAVKTHNDIHGLVPNTLMAKSLYCTDPLTGLIVATALVLPTKKLKDVTTANVLNRFKESGFAKGARREVIKQAETLLSLPLEKFIDIVLTGMKKIDHDLGL